MSDQGTGTVKPNAPGAVPGLVLGIIGVAMCWCYAIGLIPSIIALVMGSKAKKALANEPAKYQGQGMATAGFVLGIVGLIVNVIFAVIYVAIIVIAVTQGGAFRGLF